MNNRPLLLCTLNALIILLLTGCGDSIEIGVKDQTINAGDPVEVNLNLIAFFAFDMGVSIVVTDGVTTLGSEILSSVGERKLIVHPYRTGDISVTANVLRWPCLESSICIMPISKTFHVTVNQDVPIANIPNNDPALRQCIDDRNVAMVSELTYLDCSNYPVRSLNDIGFYYALEELRLPTTFSAGDTYGYQIGYLYYLTQLSELYTPIYSHSVCQVLKTYIAERADPSLNVYITYGICYL